MVLFVQILKNKEAFKKIPFRIIEGNWNQYDY